MNRRTLLKSSGALAVGALLPYGLWRLRNGGLTDRQDWLALAHTEAPATKGGPGELAPRYPSEIRLFDGQWRLQEKIPLPFVAHSIAQDPLRPHLLYAISKWGEDLAQLNFHGKALQFLDRPPSIRFFGHSVVDAQGDLLVSAHDDQLHRGLILRYRNGNLIDQFDSFGQYPHEIRIHPVDPSLLVVANANTPGRATLTWIDLRRKQAVKSVVSRSERSAGHFQFLDEDARHILLYGVHTVPSIELIDGENISFLPVSEADLHDVDLGGKMETLNAIRSPNEEAVYWVTAPEAGLVLKLDIRARSFSAVERHRNPRNVFTDGKNLYLSAQDGNVVVLKKRENDRWRTVDLPVFGASSHVTWIRPLA